MKTRFRSKSILIGAAALAAVGAVVAQASGLTRTLVSRSEISVAGREAVVVRVDVAANASAGRHTHPGDEIGYVMEGQLQLAVEGQPPRLVKAGESFTVPAGVPHDAHNDGAVTSKLVGVYVVEKGKPLVAPAP
ncbi:cupin domain-containing protein [Azohydromonas caseinilytica]|uniref:Cupin domain-containing protein n=1 Tax=Azohydromonas caseinilytica TaxID=2728836 RepID=A0A848FFJ4_9BURK|nr:cupin domain-containing protein [Azohydromonas caseinilytica]NML16920.1 cupin domain-containing protein [Azohydromonas caseinilytica]